MTEQTQRVLAVDVGGSHVKMLLSGLDPPERRRFDSGPTMTAAQMVAGVLDATKDWEYDVISVGIPARVRDERVVFEPVNLGGGWTGFDFEAAFGKPTKVVNDAVMQAIGSYEGGRMLFLGLGTGLGSALIFDGTVVPMELGHLPYKKATYEDYVTETAVERLGKKQWQKHVMRVVQVFDSAFGPDYVMLGGGASVQVDAAILPDNVRIGHNANAFVGGFRLWIP